MARKASSASPKSDDMTFEQATEELEAIIEQIESGSVGLEQSLAQRSRGEALIKRCRSILDRAEQELEHAVPDDEKAASARKSTRRGPSGR